MNDTTATTTEQKQLPPDPEGMNDSRADWAGYAIAAFQSQTGADEGGILSDLLADLMHWADRNNYDFDAALEQARGHYEAETSAAEIVKESVPCQNFAPTGRSA